MEEEAFKRANKIAIAYNIWGIALGFVLIFFNNKLSIILLLACPLVGILIMGFSKGLIKFISSAKRSPYALIMPGTMLPGFILLIKSLNQYTILQSGLFWLPALFISGLLFVMFYFWGINRSIGSLGVQVLFMAVIAMLYGFGGVRQLNCTFDKSGTRVYNAAVLDHEIRTGRSSSFYLTLAPWGPKEVKNDEEVTRGFYNKVAIGDTVQVNLRQGLLHIPWFIVTKDR